MIRFSKDFFRLVLLEKTTLGTVNTGVNKVETISARDAVFVAVDYLLDQNVSYKIIHFLVIEISYCTRFISFNSSLFRCIESKLYSIIFPQKFDSSFFRLPKFSYMKKPVHYLRIHFFVIHLINVFEHQVVLQVFIEHHYH
jgi:hypothetical protein